MRVGSRVRFPFLQSLTLSNVALTVYPSAMERPGALEQLALHNVDIVDGSLPDLGSWEHLRVLRVVGKSAAEMDEHMRAMLEACEGVEELHYEAVDMSSRPSIFDEDENGDGPPPCPALRRLCLAGFDANPHTLLSLADACPNLTDLAVLGRMVRVPQDEWTTFVQSGRLAGLQRLVVPAGQNKPPFTFWEPHQRDELRNACHSRGVSLAVGALSKSPDLD